MDIHRCRFVPYPASAINALAFSHASSITDTGKGPANLRLAIGRANGDIEIWNPFKGAWFQESVLRGGKDRTIEGLTWTQDPEEIAHDGRSIPGKLRLFSIGYSTVVTEWDLALGKPKRHSGGNYGEIWCLAAQPRLPLPERSDAIQHSSSKETQIEAQHLVVGCADGTLVIHTSADDDLRFLRTLARPSGKKSRVLCVTFKGRDVVVAGYADSAIRLFDIHNGRQIRSMSLGAGPVGGPSEILVWSVKCLPNGTIVSGDSTGEVKIWDGKHFTMLQRIKSHVADVLDLAVSVDGETIASGGMDRRSTIYRRVGNSTRRRWAEIAHQRLHSHDVKAMAAFETKDFSILASGGLDATPIIVPLREYGKEYSRSLPSLPQIPPLQSAPKKRMVMSWWNREVSIWRVPGSLRSLSRGEGHIDLVEPQSRKLIAKIAIQGEETLTSASLSSNGSILAVSTISEVKVFHLRLPKVGVDGSIKVRKIETPASIAGVGARMVQFSPDSRWLILVRPNSSLEIHRITQGHKDRKELQFSRKFVALRRLPRPPLKSKLRYGSLGNYDTLISQVAFSADSRILVTGDLSGHLDSWVLEGHEDLTQDDDLYVNDNVSSTSTNHGDDETSSDDEHPTVILGQHWIRNPAARLLPKLPAPPLVLSFRPTKNASLTLTNGNTAVHPTRQNPHPHSHDLPDGEDRLFALTCEHKIYEYEVLAGKLSDWSRRNPAARLPRDFRDVRDRAMGSVWDISDDKERIWLYGSSWLWMFDLSKDLPLRDAESSAGEENMNGTREHTKLSRKRKRGPENRETKALLKHDTGAGSRIPESELATGIGRTIRRTNGPECDDPKWITMEQEPAPDTDDDDEANSNEGSALVSLRRGVTANVHINGKYDESMDVDSGPAVNGDIGIIKRRADGGPAYWHTYKYRPILGIVPLEAADDDEDPDSKQGGDDDDEYKPGVEVALVERPLWDLDLPPRFYGTQEWDK